MRISICAGENINGKLTGVLCTITSDRIIITKYKSLLFHVNDVHCDFARYVSMFSKSLDQFRMSWRPATGEDIAVPSSDCINVYSRETWILTHSFQTPSKVRTWVDRDCFCILYVWIIKTTTPFSAFQLLQLFPLRSLPCRRHCWRFYLHLGHRNTRVFANVCTHFLLAYSWIACKLLWRTRRETSHWLRRVTKPMS